MLWLLLGILYSFAYVALGWLLRDQATVLGWFRAAALLVPPMTGTMVNVRRRHAWSGCQWLFWATIALGLAMSAIGLTGWAADELMFARNTWLAWPAVFALFGAVAPLFALLAQPHRGAREPLAATTAIDIAGLAVVTGFLYSFFVTAPETVGGSAMTSQLKMVSELQRGRARARPGRRGDEERIEEAGEDRQAGDVDGGGGGNRFTGAAVRLRQQREERRDGAEEGKDGGPRQVFVALEDQLVRGPAGQADG